MDKKIVMIGGGPAAVFAVKAFREYDKTSEITMIQNEPYHPYYRIRLTKSLFDQVGINQILLQKKEWYEEQKVNLLLGREVTGLNLDNKTVTLEDGKELMYDELLLATGAYNFVPPLEGIQLKNAHSIRQFADVEDIRGKLEDTRTVLHIGGGIQNLEAAWAFKDQGKEVVIVEVLDRIMPRQLDSRASAILKEAIESYGIKVHLSTQIEKITGQEAVEGVLLKNGLEVPCDMVLYSVGVRPNKKLVENTKLQVNLGVVINDHMETNVENVYAAGDIAELNGRIGGLWTVAMEQGRVVGYNMAGQRTSYPGIFPVTNLNGFGLTLFSMGDIDEKNSTQTITEESEDGKIYKRLFLKEDKITGAIAIGDIKISIPLKTAIEKGTALTGIDLVHVSIADVITHLKAK